MSLPWMGLQSPCDKWHQTSQDTRLHFVTAASISGASSLPSKLTFPFPQSENGEFQEVFLPWSKFSDKWSSTTGEHTAEDPPKASSLKSITQLQIWTEGVEGEFNLQVKSIRATSAPKACPTDFPVCCPVTKLCVKPGADCVAPPVCKSSEYCCPDAKHCLEASTTSCAADAKACDSNKDFPVCCP